CPRPARLLRSRGPRRPRPLAARLPARPALLAQPDPPAADVLAVGIAGAQWRDVARPPAGAGPAGRLRIRARPRTLPPDPAQPFARSEEHTSELQSRENLVCR